MKKIVLITGATSGFGKAMAKKFASEDWHCIITGRNKDKLKAIEEDLLSEHHVDVLSLAFDVRERASVQEKLGNLPQGWQAVDVLINNAGIVLGRDSFEAADIEDWEVMIDTNLKGLLYVSKAVVPYFIQRGKGHIINIGSISGKDIYREGNVYCATKHALDVISKAQRIDLLKYGIKVTALHPGTADTTISLTRFKGDQQKADEVYHGYEPLHAEDVANVAYYCATMPAHVCINDLVFSATAQANSFYLEKNS